MFLGPLLFLLYTSVFFFFLDNQQIGYADDSPGVRVAVAEFLNRDLNRVSEWCDHSGMKLNASKTGTMIVSRSRTMYP